MRSLKFVVALFVCSIFSLAAQAASPPAMIVPGKLNVGATGAATYTMPIAVPPGSSNLAPALSLSYSSQGGDGITGLSWSLSGLSSIGRCPRTLAQDNVHGSVNYDSDDRFCLDGQRLIVISGTYGADGSQYRTEVETFSKVIAHGTAGSGPAWFEVHTKSGQILEFGNSVDSRILVVNAAGGVSSTARAWSVNKISDTVGNYLTVTYNCSQVAGACTDASRTTYGQSYPLRIDYTGNAAAGVSPYNSVRFSYATRLDQTPYYQAGGFTQNTVLLTDVQTFQTSNLVSDYQLSYRQGSAITHSHLTSVTLCDGGSPQRCLAPTTFGWQGGNSYLTLNASSPIAGGQGNQILPGDFNGDGLTDVITVNSNSCSPYNVYIGTPSMGIAPAVWGTLSTPADGAPSCSVTTQARALTGPNSIPYVLLPITAHRTSGDENDSVLITSHAGNFEAQAFPFTTSTAPSFPGDFNGDGHIDFLLQQSPTSYAYLGDGSGGFTADGGHSGLDPATTQIAAADFDGDGCTDILALPTSGSASITLFCHPATSSITPPSMAGFNVTLGDFNGDGKADILLTSTSGPGKLYFSTGTGFTLSSCSIPSGWGNYQISTSNWDGDGRADLLLVQPASGGMPGTSQIWLSTGNCFAPAVDSNNNPLTVATQSATPNPVLADWNNDGVTDIWLQENFNNGSSTPASDRLYTFNYVPELMVRVSNGIGAVSNITYDRINQNNGFYTVGTSATFPKVDVDGAFYAVRRVDANNGLATCIPSGTFKDCYSSTYAYAGAQTDVQGRGFLGFSQVAITDPQNHTVQTTNYSTDFPHLGSVTSETKTFTGNAHALSTINNTLANNSGCGVSPSSGVYVVCLTRVVTTGYDLNDTAQMPSATTDYTYDAYGNALTVNLSLSDGSSKNTTNTYSNDTTNWYLGRLLTTAVHSTVGASNLTRHSSFTYDSATGLLTQETVEAGNSTCNSGSSSCTLSTSYIYDIFGHKVTTAVFGSGLATRNSYAFYDSLGQFQIAAVNALGQGERWAFDARFGSPTSHIGPNGLPTNWVYDGFGRMTLEARADGTSSQSTYAYCTDTCPTYGAFFAQSRSFGFDGSTQIAPNSTAYFDSLSRDIGADTQGFDGNIVRAVKLYDGNGRVTQTSRPYFLTGGTPRYTTFTYDALGRVIQTLLPNTSIATQVYNGLTTSATNALNQTTTTVKNAQGLNASVRDAAGKTTNYVYDAFGNVLTVTDPAGNVVSNSYDIRGNKYRSVDPDLGTWNYVYDVAGELTSQTDAKSQTTTLTYDLLGRVSARSENGLYSTWTFGTSAANREVGQLVDTQSCTASGCSSVIADRSFTFDNLGRPATSVLQTGGNAFGYRTSYNAINGKVATIAYPSGFVLGHSYNQYGYLCVLAENAQNLGCNISGSQIVAKINTRDAEGHLTQSTAGNGVVTNQTYDPFTGLPTSLRAGVSGAVASFDYAYDMIGNLSSRTDNNENFKEGFCYDNLNRVINSAVGAVGTASWGGDNWGGFAWGAPCGRSTTSNWGSSNWNGFFWGATTCGVPNCKFFSYDGAGLGNIAGKSDVGTYSYPSAGSALPHAVSSITGVVDGLTNPIYTYDGNGNMTCVSTGAACTGTVGQQVSYTAFNMADTITKGTTTVAFAYDSAHQRVRQTATVAGTVTVTTYLGDAASGAMAEQVVVGGGTPTWTDYVKLDGQIIAQRSSTYATATWGSGSWGSLKWGVTVPASNWGAHNWGSFNWAGPATVSWAYFTLDHLGSIAVIADAAGTVVQRLSYDAWGRQRNPDGSDAVCGAISSSTTRGFTNQEQVPVSCLVNLNARLYNPTLGKLMTADPMVGDMYMPNAFNRYAYVVNNPLSFTDPSGLCFLGCFWKSPIFTAVLSVALVVVALPLAEVSIGLATQAAGQTAFAAANLAGLTAVNGAVAGAVTAGLSGGNVLEGALIGGVSAGLSSGAAGLVAASGLTGAEAVIGNAIAQGVVGGIVSEASGGDFGSGFVAAGLSSVAGSVIPAHEQFSEGRLIASAVLGGTASVIAGGKFENGAITGAFGYAAGASYGSSEDQQVVQQSNGGTRGSNQQYPFMNDPTVQQKFEQAWQQSNPDAPFVPAGQPGSLKQEQGGWIIKSLFGDYSVERVTGGTRDALNMGPKPLCLLLCSVVGDFHTHPNWNSEGYDGYIVDDFDHAATMLYHVPTVMLTHQGPIVDPYPTK